MLTLKQIRKIKEYVEFEPLMESEGLRIKCDISHRGGGVGITNESMANYLNVPQSQLPSNIGAYCNYLGGGLRGSICKSPFDRVTNKNKRKWLDAFTDMCVRVYESIENEDSLNDDTYADGDTNWEALGTKTCRTAGIESAY